MFFSTPSYAIRGYPSFLKYASEFDLHFLNKHSPSLLAQIHSRLIEADYFRDDMPNCIAYNEAFRSPSAPSEIYRAIDSVISYLKYSRAARREKLQEFGIYTEFYVPVIVVEGNLFEAVINLDSVEVHPRNHIRLRTLYRQESYIIDVVNRDYFKQFFEKMAVFHEQIVGSINALRFSKAFRSEARKKRATKLKSLETREWMLLAGAPPRRKRQTRRPKESDGH